MNKHTDSLLPPSKKRGDYLIHDEAGCKTTQESRDDPDAGWV